MSFAKWSTPARADFRKLFLWLSQFDPAIADRNAGSILAKADWLLSHPHAGSPLDTLDWRKTVVAGTRYIVLYRPTADGVEILRVHHSAENWREE